MEDSNKAHIKSAIDLYGNMVFRLALCRLQNIQDAEDVYQECFLRMLKQDVSSWDADHTKAWLIRTTINLCTDLFRMRSRHPEISIALLNEVTCDMQPEYGLIWEKVAKLPDKYRLVIHLYYGEGYDTAEIARILHVPHATVRVRLKRGRDQLKKEIGGLENVQ